MSDTLIASASRRNPIWSPKRRGLLRWEDEGTRRWDVLRPWFGPDVMQRDRELATRAEASRRRRQRPAEDMAARTSEHVIAEAEAILRSSEAKGSEDCSDQIAGAARSDAVAVLPVEEAVRMARGDTRMRLGGDKGEGSRACFGD